jgi:hypothetical protein
MAPRLRSNLLYENDDIERVGTFEKQGTFATYYFFLVGERSGAPVSNEKICRKKCTIEILRCEIEYDPSIEYAEATY